MFGVGFGNQGDGRECQEFFSKAEFLRDAVIDPHIVARHGCAGSHNEEFKSSLTGKSTHRTDGKAVELRV